MKKLLNYSLILTALTLGSCTTFPEESATIYCYHSGPKDWYPYGHCKQCAKEQKQLKDEYWKKVKEYYKYQ